MKKWISFFASALLMSTLLLSVPVASAAGETQDLNRLDSYTVYNSRPDAALREENGALVAVNTVGVTNKAIVNGTENTGDFHAQFTLTLDETGRAFCGLLFRVQSVGTSQDDTEGYELLFDRVIANDNGPRFDLSVHKFGKKSENCTGGAYLGQVGSAIRPTTGRATDEAESAILRPYGTAAGVKIIVEVTVIGKNIWAFARLADKPEIVSPAINCQLDAPVSGDTLNTYYETGSIGLIMSTDSSHDITNTISDFRITTDPTQIHEGTFSTFDDFYFFTEDTAGGFYTLPDGTIGGNGSGIKKALLRNCYEDGDISASVKLSRDAGGNLQGGLMFHATDILQWNDKMQGYAVYVNSFADDPDRVEIFLYKYGPDLTGTCAYLGIISPTNTDIDTSTGTYVESGEKSLSAGVDSWVLKVKTEGTQVKAQLISEDGKKSSPILTYDTTGAAQGGSTDIKKAVFATGGLGITMRLGTFTDFRVGETAVGTFVEPGGFLWILLAAAGAVAVAAVIIVIVLLMHKKAAKNKQGGETL